MEILIIAPQISVSQSVGWDLQVCDEPGYKTFLKH